MPITRPPPAPDRPDDHALPHVRRAPLPLVFDLCDVLAPTAAGLGELVRIHLRMRDMGGRLVLVNVGEFAHEVFRLTRLNDLLDVRPAGDARPLPPGTKALLTLRPDEARHPGASAELRRPCRGRFGEDATPSECATAFKVTGKGGRPETVCVWRKRDGIPGQRGEPGTLGPISSLCLPDGSDVNFVEKGTFQVVATGEFLHGFDPDSASGFGRA